VFQGPRRTRRSQHSADAAAKHHGVPLAFADAEALAQHPEVDLVTVCVRRRTTTWFITKQD
jgi:predicted dehydrogenase